MPFQYLAGYNLEAADQQARARVPPCGKFCGFRLCNYNGEFFVLPKASFNVLNGPGTASLPYICKEGGEIGEIKGSFEARVFYRGNFIPISRFAPPGLNKRFSVNFIRTTTIPFLSWSGIACRATKGNQRDFLHDRCMIMPINQYQEIDPESQLPQRNVSSDGSGKNCVAFRTTAPAIQIEMLWDSGDDFDLAVTEPDGDTISFRNKRSEAGNLNHDNNVGFCDSKLKFGKENILYFPGGPIESGTYKVEATHFKKCGKDPSVWRLWVAVNGVIVLTKWGVASRGRKQVVVKTTFTYPSAI